MTRRLLVAVALVGLMAAVPLSRAGAATQTTRDVTLIADPTVTVGTSTLTRTTSRISMSLQTSRLPAGHAVTVWWMVVNPDAAAPSVLYAAGHVIDDSGAAGFGGSLQEGDTDGVVELPGLSLEGLLDATAATVVVVVRDHGPARPDIVQQQIQTFDVCNPDGVEHCTDLQMSIHPAAG
jgi:hypothetical protein